MSLSTHIFFEFSTLNFRARRNRSWYIYELAEPDSAIWTERAYHGQRIQIFRIARCLQQAPQLEYLRILFGRCVAGMTVLWDRCDYRVVVVVILGVEGYFMLSCCCVCHGGRICIVEY